MGGILWTCMYYSLRFNIRDITYIYASSRYVNGRDNTYKHVFLLRYISGRDIKYKYVFSLRYIIHCM